MSSSPTVAAVVSVAAVMFAWFSCRVLNSCCWTAPSWSELMCSGPFASHPVSSAMLWVRLAPSCGSAADDGAHDERQQHRQRHQPADEHDGGGQPAGDAPPAQLLDGRGEQRGEQQRDRHRDEDPGQVGDDLAEHPQRRGDDQQPPAERGRHPQAARYDVGGVLRIAPSFDGRPGPGQPRGPFRRRHAIRCTRFRSPQSSSTVRRSSLRSTRSAASGSTPGSRRAASTSARAAARASACTSDMTSR